MLYEALIGYVSIRNNQVHLTRPLTPHIDAFLGEEPL